MSNIDLEEYLDTFHWTYVNFFFSQQFNFLTFGIKKLFEKQMTMKHCSIYFNLLDMKISPKVPKFWNK